MQRHCDGITRFGEPCGFPPRKASSFCINHEPGARTTEAAAHARAARTRSAEEFYKAGFSLDTHGAIQAVIDTVVRLVLAGRISDGTANTVLRACAIASRNFDPTNLRRPQQLDWDDYNEGRVGLLSTIDDLIFGPEAGDPTDDNIATSGDTTSTTAEAFIEDALCLPAIARGFRSQ